MKKKILISAALLISVFVLWKFVFTKSEKSEVTTEVAEIKDTQYPATNLSVSMLMDGYYELSEAFVNWDTVGINNSSATFQVLLQRLNFDDFKEDSTLFSVAVKKSNVLQTEIAGLLLDESLEEKRASFNLLSQQIFDFLKVIKYNATQVYFQECPMAMNNYEMSAFWLSKSGEMENRRNPYLGLFDAKYGKGMLRCGLTQDSTTAFHK